MSRHHILPPIVYTPPPKPKKVEGRNTRRIQKRDATSAASVGDAEESEETFASSGARAPAPPPRDPFAPIEGAEERTQRSAGKLSKDTLTTMLQAQEVENAPRDSATAKLKL
jgi:hypothetical protein